MNEKFIEQFREQMEEKSTEDLLEIWNQYNTQEWTEEVFIAIQQILISRGVNPPPHPADESSTDGSNKPGTSIFFWLLLIIAFFGRVLFFMYVRSQALPYTVQAESFVALLIDLPMIIGLFGVLVKKRNENRPSWLLMGVYFILTLGAIGAVEGMVNGQFQEEQAPKPTAILIPLPRPSPTPTPPDTVTLANFCEQGGFPLPSALAVIPGNRTHSVLIVEKGEEGQQNYSESGGNPPDWHTVNNNAELVLCMSFVSRDKLQTSCTYINGPRLNYYAGTWDLVMYVAQTGKVLDSTRLATAYDLSCAPSIPDNGRRGTVDIVEGPSSDELNTWFYKVGSTP